MLYSNLFAHHILQEELNLTGLSLFFLAWDKKTGHLLLPANDFPSCVYQAALSKVSDILCPLPPWHDLSITSSMLHNLRFAAVAQFKTFKFRTWQNSPKDPFFTVRVLTASQLCWLAFPPLYHAFQASPHSQHHQSSLLSSGLLSITKSWRKPERWEFLFRKSIRNSLTLHY